MIPGISIQIVWPMAAQEAIAADYECIEPPHLFLAVCKFAELERQYIQTIVREQERIQPLLSERDTIRAKLEDLCIPAPRKSREIRYALRRCMGKGGHPYDGRSVIHRSNASRKICRNAETVARNLHCRRWKASHLLDALLHSPPSEMQSVLNLSGISQTGPAAKTPYLDRCGRDLSASARENIKGGRTDIRSAIEKNAVCKILIEDILGEKHKKIVLIQKGQRSPKEIVLTIAGYFTGKDAPINANSFRIVELDIFSGRCLGADGEKLEKTMARLFDEIAETKRLIVYFNKFDRFLLFCRDNGLVSSLKDLLAKDSVRCIAGIDDHGHHAHLENDRDWTRCLRPVWIHDLIIPDQL